MKRTRRDFLKHSAAAGLAGALAGGMAAPQIGADVRPAEAMRIRKENPWYRGQRGALYYYI
jgi:anaerobic selenocysteine-containing dehydrogenase